MGWMTWERFRCITDCKKYPKECISENLIMEMADAMVDEGLEWITEIYTKKLSLKFHLLSYLDAGYEYVNIDDCWSELERDEEGKIVANRERFPRGINFLSDYVRWDALWWKAAFKIIHQNRFTLKALNSGFIWITERRLALGILDQSITLKLTLKAWPSGKSISLKWMAAMLRLVAWLMAMLSLEGLWTKQDAR